MELCLYWMKLLTMLIVSNIILMFVVWKITYLNVFLIEVKNEATAVLANALKFLLKFT